MHTKKEANTHFIPLKTVMCCILTVWLKMGPIHNVTILQGAGEIKFCFIYVFLPACMHVYHMFACCPQRSEEDITFLRIGVVESCELPGAYWDWNPRPLQE